MPNVVPMVCGRDRRFELQVLDGSGSALTTYPASAAVAAACWRGDDQAAVFTPAASWADATAGKVLIEVAGSDTAALAPGDYPLLLTITYGGKSSSGDGPACTLRLLPAPGSAAPPPVYCSYDDVKLYGGSIFDNLSDESDQTGFAEQRGRARIWIDATAMARAEFDLRRQKRMHSPVKMIDPYVPLDGVDGGPAWGPSIFADRDIQAQLDDIQARLDADKLIVGPLVREAAARYAASLVLERQLGQDGQPITAYQKLSMENLSRARRILASVVLRIDSPEKIELAPC